MQIVPNQKFKHGGVTYEKGEPYDVSDDDAAYFQEAGWVGERRGIDDLTLDIQSIHLGHAAQVN